MKHSCLKILLVAALVLCLALPAAVLGEPSHDVDAATIDEFLAALASDTTIHLAKGEYLMTSAKDYGTAYEEGPYTWEEVYDGYQLVIRGLNGMTIDSELGSSFITDPRYANVFTFESCSDVILSGITCGHSPEKGECAGNVLSFISCDSMTVGDCFLFGCGVEGINCFDCSCVFVVGTEIYGCSWGGMTVTNCYDVRLNGCKFHDNGTKDEPVYSLLSVNTSGGVSALNCQFTDNFSYYGMTGVFTSDIAFAGCSFTRNTFTEGSFTGENSCCLIEDCGFTDTALPGTLSIVVDAGGNRLTNEDLLAMTVKETDEIPDPSFADCVCEEPEAEPVLVTIPVVEGSYFEVGTAEEFLRALGSNRTIRVTKSFCLSDTALYGASISDFWYWENVYDGFSLVIRKARKLEIVGEPGVVITAEPRYSNVLAFLNCDNITVKSLTLGHTEGAYGSCSGDVLYFTGCRETEVKKCRIYGCGVVGVDALYCSDLEIEDSEIYECSGGAIWLVGVTDAEIEDCNIHDCGGPSLFIADDCSDIEYNDVKLNPGTYA